ncbi:MAG: acyl-CoA dehydrogenase family protein [Chloroflexi bacterium]|nr:acyl-CoA dehydrogenase family protein [Chloroflexota bacterium]
MPWHEKSAPRQRWGIDFEDHYTEAQQQFRVTVRAWLDHFVPQDLNIPPDGSPLDPETQQRVKAFRRQLGAQGWLAPTWQKVYGGGGLSPAFARIIEEEMRRLVLPSMGDNTRWIPAVMTWGTDEQKLRYVPCALRGETITWQAFNEPGSGSDLASIRTQAVADGKDYLISGDKAFITGRFDPDYLWTLAVTGPDRPPRLNLGLFMVDASLPGISIKTQRLLAGSERRVSLENVRVPADCLVGLPYQGWEIAQTILEEERGGHGFRTEEDGTVSSVLEYLRQERGSP